jgi:hypothetical protein
VVAATHRSGLGTTAIVNRNENHRATTAGTLVAAMTATRRVGAVGDGSGTNETDPSNMQFLSNHDSLSFPVKGMNAMCRARLIAFATSRW